MKYLYVLNNILKILLCALKNLLWATFSSKNEYYENVSVLPKL